MAARKEVVQNRKKRENARNLSPIKGKNDKPPQILNRHRSKGGGKRGGNVAFPGGVSGRDTAITSRKKKRKENTNLLPSRPNTIPEPQTGGGKNRNKKKKEERTTRFRGDREEGKDDAQCVLNKKKGPEIIQVPRPPESSNKKEGREGKEGEKREDENLKDNTHNGKGGKRKESRSLKGKKKKKPRNF